MRGASAWLFFAVLGVASGGCASSDIKGGIPIPEDAGDDAGDAASDAAAIDAGGDAAADASNAKPCVKDGDCDDGIACTNDSCDQDAGQCVNATDDAACADGRYCNGVEACDAAKGCVPGPPVSCSDDDPCTIDVCIESSMSCTHTPRDVDGDGDVDDNCGGGDCNDQNPAISSKHDEVCANAIDDNCNGQVDEMPCDPPPYSTCLSPLPVTAPGSYSLSTVGAGMTLAASCGPADAMTSRNVVAALTVPQGPPQRLDVKVTSPLGSAAIAIDGTCGDPSTELACDVSALSPTGLQTARARVWSLAPGPYPIVIFDDADTTVSLDVTLSEAGTPPTNETCGTATVLAPNDSIVVPLVGTKHDLPTSCTSPMPDLVYEIDLPSTQDVRVFASSADGQSTPVVSIRDAGCSMIADEIACRSDDPLDVLVRSQGPGKIFVDVSATAEDDVNLLVTLEPPTKPPADDSCATAPPIKPNVATDIDLTDHDSNVPLCATNMVDAAYDLSLSATSDVLAILHRAPVTQAALSIDLPACAVKTDVIVCNSISPSPLRANAPALAAGDYRVVPALSVGDPAELTAFVRTPATPVVNVTGADTCDQVLVIPATGGYFTGNTQLANADYSAGCDEGGVPGNGAPEQMLELTLTEKRRVIFDMEGSMYQTLLDIREGPSCPGMEVMNACTFGYDSGGSFLDLNLDPGTYFVQVDGFEGQSGAWSLGVFTGEPR